MTFSSGGFSVTELQALQHRRKFLLQNLCKAAGEIEEIYARLSTILAGNQGQGGM